MKIPREIEPFHPLGEVGFVLMVVGGAWFFLEGIVGMAADAYRVCMWIAHL